jgi:hypothetical protein
MINVNIPALSKFKFEYKITFLYFIIGLLWIFLPNTFFNSLIVDKQLLTDLQIVKSFLYIIITSFFVKDSGVGIILPFPIFVKKHFNKR